VAPFLQDFGSATAALQRLEKDMNHESALDGTSDTGDRLPETISGEIEFRNVSFTYPSRPDYPVIQDLSLVCPAGKHTAICGLSGSGKSTVAALIGRLYDPLQGSILLDGHDLRELNLRQVRSFISLVQQEPSLLDRSILENIALGLINSPSPQHSHLKPILLGAQLSELAAMARDGQDLTQAANTLGPIVVEIVDLVRTAATLADAITFIDGLEHGLATQVGSIGNLISGGQKQRISLARALVRYPKILILDEATSALDSESEQRVQASIERILEGRTLVSIAHRLSTIKNADNIIVMRQGRIVEQGGHAELIARDGAYAAMVRLQSLAHGEPADGAEITDGSIEGVSVGDSVLAAKESLQEETTVLEKGNSTTPDAEEVEFVIPLRSSSWTMFKKMLPLVRPYLLILLAAFFTSCIVGGSYSAEAVIFGNTVDSLSPCQTEEYIRQRGRLFGLLFFILAIVEFFANVISWSAFGYFAEQILLKVRVLSFRSLFEQDLQWHQSENRNPAMLLAFITKDGNALGGLTGSTMGTLFSIMVNMLVAIILAHIIAWKIALVCLVTVPILLGAGIMQLRVLSQFEERHENAFAQSTGITVEAINSIKTVASLSLETEILRVYRRSLKGPRKEITRASAYANFWLAVAYSVGNFVYALAYWWGAKQIIEGEYTQTQFFIVLLALLVSAQLWGQMFMLAPDLSKAWAAIARILYLIDLGSTKPGSLVLFSPPGKDGRFGKDEKDEKDIEAAADTKSPSPPDSSHGLGGVDVVLRDLKFSYPARPHIEVLRGLSIEIKAGQFCALVGPSGAGKSTILALIERMYIPSAGRISIGNRDIVQNSDVSFRDTISLVPQDSTLFDGSVRFNVSLGAPPGREATDAEIETACRLANIHDTIAALPQGYETNCGPNGNQLSGGQKQRLAIARALVRRPRLLLLDESTSALDAESESLLQQGLDVAARGITVVAIAHRLRTIRRADVIFLIEGGVCVDQGTHEELVARSERYRVNTMHQT
jgi:ATP-binding cassette subfamily B (MDR/TAP) protein 1